jgi:hypothetical protein
MVVGMPRARGRDRRAAHHRERRGSRPEIRVVVAARAGERAVVDGTAELLGQRARQARARCG